MSATGGERKHLTILFADIRNSTELIAAIDPEQAMRRMQPVLDAMKDAVHRYDGIVNKVQGDGVMALFGAPRPHEDHAVRGCLAALAMQDAVARLGDPDLGIRVGVHTGEVVVQTVENSLSQTYDAAGAAAHLASRMEQMADSGSVLVTAATFNEARQFLVAVPLGERAVRGLGTPVEVLKLIGLRHAPASERFRSGPRPSGFLGREPDLAALETELASAVSGEARVIGIIGEAGVGKSRLCFEFLENCRRRGIRVAEARVHAHGRATPFQPILELLRDAFAVRPDEPADLSRRKVLDVLGSRGDFSASVPVLLEFLGLPDAANPAPKPDAAARKSQLLDFLRQFIHSRPDGEALVVLVEDLHWIDAASEDFVAAIVDAIVGTRTLLVLNFRPGIMASWMQRSHYRQIILAPLESARANQLVRELLGDDPSLGLVSRNIVERAQGNPFFLEELVHSLVERGDFEGERGAYRLRGGLDAVPLPKTVQAVLSARIDRLPEPARQMLQAAAVIGREVPIAVLEPVVGLAPNELAEALRQLRQAELLYELPPFGQGLHAFRHPLIQEVAYRSLLSERRRQLHAAAARAIEDHFKNRLDENAGLLGYHLEQAGLPLEAARANVRAAIWVGANDPSHALKSWKKVRELLLAQPADRSVDYLKMMASAQIVNFGWREGIAAEEARHYFEEARELALKLGDMRANALIHAGYGRILGATGSADEYVARIREAEALAGASIDPSLQVTLKAILCHALRLSGRMTEALAANVEALDRIHEVGQFDRQMLGFDIEPWLLAMRGQTLVMLGRGEEARHYLDRVIEMDAARVDAIHHAIPHLAYVELAWANGDPQLAEQHAEHVFSTAVKTGNPYLRVYAQAARGLAHVVAGQLDESVKDFIDALGFARRRKAGLESEARILADLANAYRLKGDFELAMSAAAEAIAIATARHTRIAECLARIVHAEAIRALRGAGGSAEAEEELSRAEALVEETGAVIFVAFNRAAKSRLAAGKEPAEMSRDTATAPRQVAS